MDVNGAIESVKKAGELFPNSVASIDGVVSTIVNVFNDILLYPVKKANLTFRYKLEQFSDDLAKEIVKNNVTNFKEPDVSIVGPTIEAMCYSMDNEELRKMYIKLLATSVNADAANGAHPSFVEIIKRMDAVDAVIFKSLSKMEGYIPIANPRISIKGTNRHYISATPEWYMADLDHMGIDIFARSSSVVRLSKFGLIELMYDRTAGDKRCDWVPQSDELQRILHQFQRINPIQELEIKWTDSILYVNDYGRQFAHVCL